MTRRVDGVWELTQREVRSLIIILPLLTLVFAAGGAWGAVQLSLDSKVDKRDFMEHTQKVGLTMQALHINDSLQLEVSRELTHRVRELVCEKRPACR